MFTARKKIVKEKGVHPDQFEMSVAQAIYDLEVNANDLKNDLRELVISGAKEVELPNSAKKVVVITVPFRLLRKFHKIQLRLVRELEKKFSGKHVVIVGQRRILRRPSKGSRAQHKQKRPRSRTLTAVHEAILDDICYPTEIVGKRTRVRTDGSKLIKVILDRKDQPSTEYKLEAFAGVYKKLTGKDVEFLFPVPQDS